MTASILAFPRDVTPDDALERSKGTFASVFIAGTDGDGNIITDGAGPLSLIEAIGLLELIKNVLMNENAE